MSEMTVICCETYTSNMLFTKQQDSRTNKQKHLTGQLIRVYAKLFLLLISHRLCEAGFLVDLVDFANGADVSGSADIQSKVEVLEINTLG